jgi:hypothetical protein
MNTIYTCFIHHLLAHHNSVSAPIRAVLGLLGKMSKDTSPCFISLLILGLVVTLAGVIPQVEARAFFVFGDSLVDNGNNNYLATTARADAPPYGVDYPTRRATGRFSNGLNIPDLISRGFFLFIYQSDFLLDCAHAYHVINLLHSSLMSILYITR